MTNRQFNIDKLQKGCEQLGIAINENQQESLLIHIDLLAKWNKKLNLTAIDSEGDMITHHILDSLAIHRYVKGRTLLDIGTGAGFPGLPLAIIDPGLQATLLDSRGKRVEFLRHAISKIGVTNVSLSISRIEDYRAPLKFDTLTARAFSSVAELVRLSKKHLDEGTRVLALKGRYPKQEISTLAVDWPGHLHHKVTVKKLEVPFIKAQRHLIIIDL